MPYDQPRRGTYDGRIAVTAGARRLLNITPSIDAVVSRLRGLSLFNVLNTTGRIDAVLRDTGFEMQSQLRILSGLMGPEMAETIGRRLALMHLRMTTEGDAPGALILFSPPALAALVKIAALTLDPLSSDSEVRLDRLAEAILIVNDLLDEENQQLGLRGPSTPANDRTWAYYISVRASIEGGRPAAQIMVRAHELYLTGHAELRNHQDFIDLPSLFHEATGLSLHEYSLALIVFLGTMYRIDSDTVSFQSPAIAHEMLRHSLLRMDAERIDRFLRLAGLPATEFVDRARARSSLDDLNSRAILTLEESPLVHFPTQSVCLSITLLEQRLTDGLYHVLLNARGGAGAENVSFRYRFMRFLGHVFDAYVARSMKRIAGYQLSRFGGVHGFAAATCRYVSEGDFRGASENASLLPIADGVLLMGDNVIVVETKAQMLALAARSGNDEDAFFKRLEEIVVDAAAQLQSTIEQIASGAFVQLGLVPRRIKRIFPLVVSLQPLMMNPLLRRWIDRRLQERRLLQATRADRIRIRPLEVFDADDLEWLELAAEHGDRSVPDLLMSKQGDAMGDGMDFSSWSKARRIPAFRSTDRSSYYTRAYEVMTGPVLEAYRPAHE